MKKILLVIFTFAVGFTSFAQEVEENLIRTKSGKTLYTFNNAFKVDVAQILVGDIIFAYERAFNFNNAFEIEMGPTISNLGLNSMRLIGNNRFLANSTQPSYVQPDYQQNIGFLMSVAYKKYLLNDYLAFNGLYIAPRLKFRNYNGKANYFDFNIQQNKEYKDILNQLILTFDVGMTHAFKAGFGIEYYASFGLTTNMFKFTSIEAVYENEDEGNYTIVGYNDGVYNKSFFTFHFGIGLKLSFLK